MSARLSGYMSTYPVPTAPPLPRTLPDLSAPRPLGVVASEYDDSGRRYPFFVSGHATSSKAVVFIGGLYNGLQDVPYLPTLSSSLEKAGWKLVQMHWSGAYEGYGLGSLDRDVLEMGALVKHLRDHEGIRTVVIMGHSTGSQDVIDYLSSPLQTVLPPVDGGIMQAPVSDREYHQAFDEGPYWLEHLHVAENMIREGKGNLVMPDEVCDKLQIKISAYRLWSLLSPVGDDDYFSHDIPTRNDPDHPHPHTLNTSFGRLSAPALALFSEKDEVPQIGAAKELLQKWQDSAKGKLSYRFVEGASHDVKESGPQEWMCGEIVHWLADIGK